MAANEAAVEPGMAAAPAPAKGGGRKWLVVSLLVLLLAGGGGAAWYVLMAQPAGDEAGAKDAPKAKLQYIAIEPTFTVNLADKPALRFLQLQMEVATRDPKTLLHIEEHMPAIRHNLLMLFGSKSYEDLRSREGKQALQQAALDEIRATLTRQDVAGEVESVLFTSFVMQ